MTLGNLFRRLTFVYTLRSSVKWLSDLLFLVFIVAYYSKGLKIMATLDDKLMGEKLHYYCSSSSESEGEDEDGEKLPPAAGDAEPAAPNGSCQWDGTSCNVNYHFHQNYTTIV